MANSRNKRPLFQPCGNWQPVPAAAQVFIWRCQNTLQTQLLLLLHRQRLMSPGDASSDPALPADARKPDVNLLRA